jgi:hypothetical protein
MHISKTILSYCGGKKKFITTRVYTHIHTRMSLPKHLDKVISISVQNKIGKTHELTFPKNPSRSTTELIILLHVWRSSVKESFCFFQNYRNTWCLHIMNWVEQQIKELPDKNERLDNSVTSLVSRTMV